MPLRVSYQCEPQSSGLPAVMALFVIISMIFLNMDGYHLHLISPWSGPGDVTSEPPEINWVHGWPIGFAVRSSIYSQQRGKGVPVQSIAGRAGLYSRWPIDEAPIAVWSWAAAIADFAICGFVVCGAFAGSRSLASHFGWKLRFTMRSMMLVVTIISIAIATRNLLFTSRYVLESAAFGIAMCGCGLSAWRLVQKVTKRASANLVSATVQR
jgi:hypothetical protein